MSRIVKDGYSVRYQDLFYFALEKVYENQSSIAYCTLSAGQSSKSGFYLAHNDHVKSK